MDAQIQKGVILLMLHDLEYHLVINHLKGTHNSHNFRKPHDNNVYIGYRQAKPYIHMKDIVLARVITTSRGHQGF